MIDTHGALLLVEDGADTPTASSGSTTPLPSAKSSGPSLAGLSLSSSSSAVTTSTTTGNDGKSFNTSVVKAEGEFQCSKEDLFEFLTDEVRLYTLWNVLAGQSLMYSVSNCRKRFLYGLVTQLQ